MPGNQRRPIRAPADGLLLLLAVSLAASCAQAQHSPPGNNYGYGYTYSKASMVIMIAIGLAVLFGIGFFFLYLRRCSSGVVLLAGGANSSSHPRISSARRGLDKALIASFPKLAYSDVKDLKVSKGSLECAVCLCEFEDCDDLMLLPGCRHVFHSDCAGAWLESHITCPVCRSNLVDSAAHPGTPLVAEGDGSVDPTTDRVEIAVSEEVDVCGQEAEAADLARIGSLRREAEAVKMSPIPRSASERQAAMREGEGEERYTLRLPDEAIAAVVAVGLGQTTNCLAPNSRGEGEGWSGRLAGALARTFSTKFPSKRMAEVNGEEEESENTAGEGAAGGDEYDTTVLAHV